MKKLQRQLFKLLRLHSPSGQEAGVRKYLLPILGATMDNVFMDSYGNLYAKKKYGPSNYQVLFSAHMDTVATNPPVPQWRKNKTEIFTTSGSALGGDDKCGIAAFLAIIREMNRETKFNGTLKVIFSRQEEQGCVGASQAVDLNPKWFEDIDTCIVIDRRGGDDIVTGCWSEKFCSQEYGEFWEQMGKKLDPTFKPWAVEGSISDTMIFSEKGINGVNLSAGYYSPHTKDEYIKIDELKRTIRWVLVAMDEIHNHKFPSFKYYSDDVSHWSSNKYYTSKSTTSCGTYFTKKWVVCDWCRMEWEDDEMVVTSQGEHVCPDCQDYFHMVDDDTFECQMCGQDKPEHEHIDYRGFDLCAGCALAMDIAIKEG